MAGTAAEPVAKRGRRLDEDRSELILSTVLELVHEGGYDQLRMQDVADRAGVGLSTIYRRWPTKQECVRASLECERAKEKYVTTGDPRADAYAFFRKLAEDLSGDGAQTFLGFLTSMRSDPEIAEVFSSMQGDLLRCLHGSRGNAYITVEAFVRNDGTIQERGAHRHQQSMQNLHTVSNQG